MLPFHNPFPQLPNQSQQTKAPAAPPSQQVMSSNPSFVNSCNSLQSPMQFLPHLGMNNAQIQVPFSNSNAHFTPNMRPSVTQPGLMNVPTHLLPFQNTLLGMPHLGSQPGQFPVGFGPQNSVCNTNAVAGFPVNGQFCNLVQNANQANVSRPHFVHSLPHLTQQLNQNMGLPNGQYGFPNVLQNMNQLVALQMPASSQVSPYCIPPCPPYMLGGLNQLPQATIPQNPSVMANMQFGLLHCNQVGQQENQNQQNLAPPTNGCKGNTSAPLNHRPVQPQHTENLKTTVFTRSQGNTANNGGTNIPSSNWKHSPRKNFTRNSKRMVPEEGFQKSQFHHMKNAKRKFGFPSEHKGKGCINGKAGKFGLANSTNQAREHKRSLYLTYSEQEIQQWREARRKNYPSNANIEKKLSEKISGPEGTDRDAQLRKAQLKEILAKQAELGVEVAEVPSHYLSDSKKQGHGREDNRRSSTKKGRSRNKFDKRGRSDKKERFAKKQRLEEKDLSNVPSLNERQPTLLQKLLSADINRDKTHLLQVFRFMVMNSFFKDWPGKPLKVPVVIIKESGSEGGVVEEKASPLGKDAEGSIKTMAKKFNNEDDKNDGKDSEDDQDGTPAAKNDAQVREVSYFVRMEGRVGEEIQKQEEEEGEIID